MKLPLLLMRHRPLWILAALSVVPFSVSSEPLKVFLLAGQSNMEGHGYTYEASKYTPTATTIESLLDPSASAQNYVQGLRDGGLHTFLDDFDSAWMTPRDDAWCVHYLSLNGSPRRAEPNADSASWTSQIAPLSPGFGVTNDIYGSFGPELGMGQRLGRETDALVFLFKSDRGGTNVFVDWRPPSAVSSRGGTVGIHFTNTVARFRGLLDQFDAEISNNTFSAKYGGATGYEVAGFVWLQGWNEIHVTPTLPAEDIPAARLEYEANLVDLVRDIRGSDPRIPDDLPAILIESSDQDDGLNASRQAAVAQLNTAHPGSAVFVGTDGLTDGNHGHFRFKSEAYLEIGWRAGGAVIDNGYIDVSPLRWSSPRLVSSSFNQADVEATINDNADAVSVVWDVVDHGTDNPADWPHSMVLGVWTGGEGQVTATLGSLTENTAYVFRFFASSASLGVDAWSDLRSFTTPFENDPPLLGDPATGVLQTDGAEVSCLLIQAAAATVTVVWAHSDQGVVDVADWLAAPGGGSAALGAAIPGDVLNHTMTGLGSGASYVYRFFASGPTGSDWSATGSFTTLVSVPGGSIEASVQVESGAPGALSLSGTDLLQTSLVSSHGVAAFDNGGQIGATLADGQWGTHNSTSSSIGFVNSNYVEFHLDTSSNTLGYDIASIVTSAWWSVVAGGRSEHYYSVEVSYVGDAGFVELVPLTHHSPGNLAEVTQVTLSDDGGVLQGTNRATGVDAIKFVFGGNPVFSEGASGQNFLREIDVFGVPTVEVPDDLMKVTEVRYLADNREFSFSWVSLPSQVFSIYASADLLNWTEIASNHPSGGEVTTYTETVPLPEGSSIPFPRRFYRAGLAGE